MPLTTINPGDLPDYITHERLQRLLGVSRATLYTYKVGGKLPPCVDLVPGRLLYRRADVEKLLVERAEKAAAKAAERTA